MILSISKPIKTIKNQIIMTTNVMTMPETNKIFGKLLNKKLAQEILFKIRERYYCELTEDIDIDEVHFLGFTIFANATVHLKCEIFFEDENGMHDWEVLDNEIEKLTLTKIFVYSDDEEVDFNETQTKVLLSFLQTHINQML